MFCNEDHQTQYTPRLAEVMTEELEHTEPVEAVSCGNRLDNTHPPGEQELYHWDMVYTGSLSM